jgi:hypothetical protein
VKSVGRGGGVLSGPASFLAQRLSNLNGVLNIAEAAVSPSLMTELKRLLNRPLARQLPAQFFVTPDPFGTGIGG